MKKSIKQLKDGNYYWVKRPPRPNGDGVHVYPRWEPMLWEASTSGFHSRGDRQVYSLEGLEAVGEMIERRSRRVTRKAYIPTITDKVRRRADPDYYTICSSAKAAAKLGSGLPIPVEVSWSIEDQNVADAFARLTSPKTP